MSAIAGIVHFNKEPISIEYSRGIMKALSKFPADDVQTWQKDHVFLGCHAQWITPESIGEQLPFYDYQRQLAITADAIIDNREELFEKLQIHKEDRKQITDSQLILLAYHKWGEDSPKFLVGDFAFMIWDEREQKLFGARDLSGYRTLYYYMDNGRFSFCTTLAPLLSLSYVKKKLNEEWLAEYLAITGTIDTVDARTTPYKNIDQVPPAHSITISKGKIKLNRYGSFFTGERLKLSSNEEYVEAFQEVFQEAVDSRLRTFKNVGSQLSGGLDSGAVVGFAARTLKKQNKILHTFSYIPPEDFVDFTPKHLLADERPFIKSTVQYTGGINDHYLDFEGKSSYTEIDDMLEAMEMPYKFFENSFWLKGVFECAEVEGIGVLLNGDRGNFTISWGSALDYYAKLLRRLKWFKLLQELNQYSIKTGGARLRRLPTVVKLAFPVIRKIPQKKTGYYLPALINKGFAKRTSIYEKLEKYGVNDTGWITAANIFDERKNLIGNNIFPWNTGNTLITKLSLRHSMWKRDPTNDLRVVRFCLSIPEEQYVQNGVDRALVRRATETYLPDTVRLNQRIRGVQGTDWVHRMASQWDKFIEELKILSTDTRILDFLDKKILREAIAKGEKGPQVSLDTDPDYRTLMRSLIVYRFINKINEGGD
ncbi:lasso peptide isopeptide bond-forming cyclase [Bacillus dakarensis]|uniref:lasso peptide isopeptide bond-forming cyclase n=1 Tax=Robertmurraya dakarensis TaxID=1926278 RepID=UPI0009810060|nr:lasso peptide isopeptide bond-forming cyclase [Bacillus dakarensis]